jgi:hypothetical protein
MATMPISFGRISDANQDQAHSMEMHHHCEETLQKNQSNVQSSKQNNFVNHSCCSIVAVLPEDLVIKSTDKSNIYLVSPLDKPTSYVLHSIYKPPKNQIS